jgi:violaxanthin de-epoxidase
VICLTASIHQACARCAYPSGIYPVPNDCALDEKFDLAGFTGRWYITAGLNPLFDTFDCQAHFFGVPEPGADGRQTHRWT